MPEYRLEYKHPRLVWGTGKTLFEPKTSSIETSTKIHEFKADNPDAAKNYITNFAKQNGVKGPSGFVPAMPVNAIDRNDGLQIPINWSAIGQIPFDVEA